MRTRAFWIPLALALPATLLVACGSGYGGSGNDGSTESSPFGLDPGSPHTPATGCHEGFVACGDVCAHLADDSHHCGACDNRCDHGAGCVGGTCAPGQGCTDGRVSCDGVCTTPDEDADNCGSCGNRCSDEQLCADGVCMAAGGDGTSCEGALFWDLEESESAGFRFTKVATARYTFSCGSNQPLPTRWFRFSAPKDHANIRVSGGAGDRYVIEVYSGPACDPSAFIACNDQEATQTKLDLATTEGELLHVAVGLKGSWSGEPAVIRVDH